MKTVCVQVSSNGLSSGRALVNTAFCCNRPPHDGVTRANQQGALRPEAGGGKTGPSSTDVLGQARRNKS